MATKIAVFRREDLPKCKYCREPMTEIDTTHAIRNESGICDVYLFICRHCTNITKHLVRQKHIVPRDDKSLVAIPINNCASLADADIRL